MPMLLKCSCVLGCLNILVPIQSQTEQFTSHEYVFFGLGPPNLYTKGAIRHMLGTQSQIDQKEHFNRLQ